VLCKLCLTVIIYTSVLINQTFYSSHTCTHTIRLHQSVHSIIHCVVRQVVPEEQLLSLWAAQYKEQLKQSPVQDMKFRNIKNTKNAKTCHKSRTSTNLSLHLVIFRLHRMHETQTILSDVRGVCQSVRLSVTRLKSAAARAVYAACSGVIRCGLRQITLTTC